MHSEHEVVEAYLRYWATGDDQYFWAWEYVDSAVWRDREKGWTLVTALVAASDTDAALMYVAAGPLQDWICYHGGDGMDVVAAEAKRNARFKSALGGVWGRNAMKAEVASKLDAILGR